MNSTALTMMLITEITVTCITGYFFYKVLKTPPKAEPDSYTENDDVKR
jgi:hypothetical protein